MSPTTNATRSRNSSDHREQVYGTSDKHGAYVKNLGATIYHAPDVSLDTRLTRDGDVPRPITTGEPILELFG